MIEEIAVALLPAETRGSPADCYVVVDVLRATTTLAVLLAQGAACVWSVDSLARARALADERQALLAGEVGGIRPEGFDFGNSPREIDGRDLAQREVVHFTTNGTAALCGLAALGPTFAAAMVNANAVAVAVAGFQRITVVCSGEAGGTRFALEDFAAAATVVEECGKLAPAAHLDDASLLALALAGESREAGLVAASSHAEALRRIGLAEDIAYCTRRNTLASVPRVVEHGPGFARIENAGR